MRTPAFVFASKLVFFAPVMWEQTSHSKTDATLVSKVVVTGISTTKIVLEVAPLTLSIRFIEVYQENQVSRQLLAWQASRIPNELVGMRTERIEPGGIVA